MGRAVGDTLSPPPKEWLHDMVLSETNNEDKEYCDIISVQKTCLVTLHQANKVTLMLLKD